MTAISRPLKPKPDRPVEPIALLVIQEIQKASKALGLPVFLVGAMARVILLEHVHGLTAGRATTDVDFAFALDNWDQFTAIKASLLANADFEQSKHVAHRLHFRPEGLEHQYKVDLIPFGGIETSPNTIAWPPDMAVLMNVAGFGDALAAAVSVQVSPGIEIAVASLPGIAILKLFAWADRGQESAAPGRHQRARRIARRRPALRPATARLAVFRCQPTATGRAVSCGGRGQDAML